MGRATLLATLNFSGLKISFPLTYLQYLPPATVLCFNLPHPPFINVPVLTPIHPLFFIPSRTKGNIQMF